MQFDRDKLEEEVLEKVKEVNEESGYRPYFELPEYVNIVASVMEEKFRVEYDDLVNQIHLLSKELDKAQSKAEILEEKRSQWEACADHLIGYVEIIQKASRPQPTKHYSPISRDIEQYEKLKSETQSHE
jgi:hypothetical protein